MKTYFVQLRSSNPSRLGWYSLDLQWQIWLLKTRAMLITGCSVNIVRNNGLFLTTGTHHAWDFSYWVCNGRHDGAGSPRVSILLEPRPHHHNLAAQSATHSYWVSQFDVMRQSRQRNL